MSGKLIFGLDGGATKSHLAVFDCNGKCAGITVYGPLNHEVMRGSFTELEDRLSEFISSALKKADASIDDVAYAVFGLAGADTDAQHDRIKEIVRRIGLKEYVVYNDAFLGVAAGCPNCVGICAINGTGFKLAAIDKSAVAVQTCGVGEYSDDRGGGSWYGLRAIGSVYNELYRLGKPTAMREMIYELIGVSRREDYLEVIAEKFPGGRLNSVALNSVVFNAAALGDAVALGVLEESAEQYAGAIARLAMDMDFPQDETLHVTLAGSVFVRQKVRILQELIEKRVDKALGERVVEYTRIDTPPVAGAVIWAAQKAGINIDMTSIKAALKAAGL